MLPRSSRVLWLCLLAGCAGGPISEFPFGSGDEDVDRPTSPPALGGGNGGSAPPSPEDSDPAGAQDAGAQDAGAQDAGTQDAGTQDAGTQDAGAQDAGAQDAGAENVGEQVPCGLRFKEGSADTLASASCEGDYCGLSLAELRGTVREDSVCFTALREVCENRVQQTVSTCQSLVGSDDFQTFCARAVFAPEVVSDACIACYGAATACAEQNCGAAECAAGAADEACDSCKALHCGEAFRRCSGLAPSE